MTGKKWKLIVTGICEIEPEDECGTFAEAAQCAAEVAGGLTEIAVEDCVSDEEIQFE